MDTETKFLAIFYALLGGITAAVLLAVLAASAEVAAFLVIVIGMFAMMGVLLTAGLGGDDSR
jgi:hypothetical protein